MDRVGVLIGKHGETKRLLEKRLGVELDIQNESIHIKGDADKEFFAKDVIKAIGRGFSPEKALLLTKEEYNLEIIDLDHFFSTKNSKIRIKGRIIGKEGKVKKRIEEITDSYISVYGDTVSIIAPYYSMSYVKEIIELILKGAKHSTIFNVLSKMNEEIRFLKLKSK